MPDALTAEIVHKLVWKSYDMDGYANALLAVAHTLYLDYACVYFNNDDVPEDAQPLDGNTVGLTIKLLCSEGILSPWRGNVPDLEIWGGMRRSSRKCCHGHRNPLYGIASMSKLETWLERHGSSVEQRQGELFNACATSG